jgi:Rrf2 family transcriptional regulator, iron-sulfur cluster assembly transcription factor
VLNQSAQYALQAVVQLARLSPGASQRAAELAATLDVPANYLSKVLHQLASAGVLLSRRGRDGGFALAVPPSELRLSDVVGPFDDVEQYRECVLGRPSCNARDACAAHHGWKPIASSMSRFLNETSVEALTQPAHRVKRRSRARA